MKIAKEMFEKLGYHLIKQASNTQHLIEYQKTNKKYGETETISFNTSGRTITKYLETRYGDEGYCYEEHCIFINELKAINKQVEELWGWLK